MSSPITRSAGEGIDGTRIFTHFPPADTYNAQIFGEDSPGRPATSRTPVDEPLAHGVRPRRRWRRTDPRDDGARAAVANLEGSPKVVVETPRDFFTKAEAEYPDAPVWVGELYLEFHRGTYTTHVNVKQSNRRTEHQLFEAELWATTATLLTGAHLPVRRDSTSSGARRWSTSSTTSSRARRSAGCTGMPRSSYEMLNERLRAVIADCAGGLLGVTGQASRRPGRRGAVRRVVANAAPHARRGAWRLFGAGTGGSCWHHHARTARGATRSVLDNGLVRVRGRA